MTLSKRVLAQVLTRIHMIFASPHNSNNTYSYSGIKQKAYGSQVRVQVPSGDRYFPLTPRAAHEPRRLPITVSIANREGAVLGSIDLNVERQFMRHRPDASL